MLISLQHAVQVIECQLREAASTAPRNPNNISTLSSYGYDIYLTSLATNKLDLGLGSVEYEQAVSVLMDAAWWFIARGLLRPGVRVPGAQSTIEGTSVGFSITATGRLWLSREAPPELPLASPSHMITLLEGHRGRFGLGFMQRAIEAVNCYEGRQYLACCVMAGAAAEGIVLTAAFAKSADEEATLRTYLGREGRRAIERSLTGQAPHRVQEDFRSYMGLLKFWRDNAAHGAVSEIAEEEAYLALIGLARFARFVEHNWGILTT